MKNYLGEFEELVLLTVGVLGVDAYGVAIKQEMEVRTRKKPSIGALHTTLNRLEQKGFVKSWEGGATAARGGRRKRFYNLTATGKSVLQEAHTLRAQFLNDIPNLSIDNG